MLCHPTNCSINSPLKQSLSIRFTEATLKLTVCMWAFYCEPFISLPVQECLHVSLQKHISACIMSWPDNSCDAIFTPLNRNGRIFIGYASKKKKDRWRRNESERIESESKWMESRQTLSVWIRQKLIDKSLGCKTMDVGSGSNRHTTNRQLRNAILKRDF